jgi:hypothetical protein
MVECVGSPHPGPLPEGEGGMGEGTSEPQLCACKFRLQRLAYLL